MNTYQLYIDESCHLEHDGHPVMCLGYTRIEGADLGLLKAEFLTLQQQYRSPTELKWNKLSGSRLPLYQALIDWFFAQPIQFRCILVKYKDALRHEDFNQGDHTNFYYKLVYHLVNAAGAGVQSQHHYRVYLDIKDTRGRERLHKIREVLGHTYDGASPFQHFQHIRSEESPFLQLTDLLIGAVTYAARGLHKEPGASAVKKEVIAYLETKTGYYLNAGTPPWEDKFNIFDHQPRARV